MTICFGPWQGSATTGFRHPPQSRAAIDLRSLPAHSENGFGVFDCGDADPGSEYTALGEPGDTLPEKHVTLLRDALNPRGDFDPHTVADAIQDLLGGCSDPEGQAGPLPVMPEAGGFCPVYLGGHVPLALRTLGQPGTSRDEAHFTAVKEALKPQLSRVLVKSLAGEMRGHDHRQYLKCKMAELPLGTDWKTIVPPEWDQADSPRLANTDYSDNFAGDDAADLGASWTAGVIAGWTTWTRLTNNARWTPTVGTQQIARYQTDFASDAMYSRVTAGAFTTVSASNLNLSAVTRKDSAATLTYYMLLHYAVPAGYVEFFKVVGGVGTVLFSTGSSGVTYASGVTIRLEDVGSSHQGNVNNSFLTGLITDTAITGNTRAGFRGVSLPGDGLRYVEASDWAGGDLTVLSPVASISATPLSGATPLAVQFTGSSLGGAGATWAWTFGDGATSTSQSPTHTYTTVGTYTVTLTVTNAAGSSVATATAYITASWNRLLRNTERNPKMFSPRFGESLSMFSRERP